MYMKKTFRISENNPFPEETYLGVIHLNALRASERLGKNLDEHELEKLVKVLKTKDIVSTSRNSSDLVKIYIREGKKKNAFEILKED